jgi:hypothetical protein
VAGGTLLLAFPSADQLNSAIENLGSIEWGEDLPTMVVEKAPPPMPVKRYRAFYDGPRNIGEFREQLIRMKPGLPEEGIRIYTEVKSEQGKTFFFGLSTHWTAALTGSRPSSEQPNTFCVHVGIRKTTFIAMTKPRPGEAGDANPPSPDDA